MLGGLACAADAGAGFQAQAHEAGCGGGEWTDEGAGAVETVQQGAAGGGHYWCALVFNCRRFTEEPSLLVTVCSRQRRIGSTPVLMS
jgi:hypothetical protein